MRFLLFLISFPAFGAVANLAVVGSTQTQIIISYTAPDASACTVEASKEADYTPLAPDVDNSLFANEHLDSRAGNLTTGRSRRVVLGKQGGNAIAATSNGVNYSRALQADTQYYIRVTCGADTAEAVARTANVIDGDARGDALAVESPFNYKRVTTNPRLMPSFVDPYTGVLTYNIAELFGWNHLVSTAKASTDGDCAKTLSGVAGSCLFKDASGTNWTSTSGTVTDAIRADDSNYAEYSGTAQDILIVRLGTPRQLISTSFSTQEHKFSFQNVILRGKTSTTTGDGEEIETCLSMDAHVTSPPTCDSPWITTNLTTSDTIIRICADSPCTTADNPGDWMTYHYPSLKTVLMKSRIYNETGTFTTMKLAGDDAVADCNRIQSGVSETFYTYKLSTNTGYTFTVTGKDCGASPPTLTVTESVDFTHNGTRGVGWWIYNGINSEHYSLLVRKKSTTSGSTISIGYALWRASWVNTNYLNEKSGGFGQKCQTIPTAAGYYLCMSGHGIFGMKPNAAGDGMDFEYYGTTWINPATLGGSAFASVTTLCMGPIATYAAWDLTVPGKFRCSFQSTYPNPWKVGEPVDGRAILADVQMNLVAATLPVDPAGVNDGLSPRIGITSITNLTPCLNSCADTTDDYTPFGQAMRFTSGWTDPLVPFDVRWGSPGFGTMLDANTLHGGVQISSQDSLAWYFAFDLGNGLPVGSGFVGTRGGNTQNIFAGMHYGNNAAGRFCGVHTSNLPVAATGAPFTAGENASSQPCVFYTTQVNTLSSCNVNSGTCTSCDSLLDSGNLVMDGYSYSGKSICSLLQVTSTWPSGTPHSLWEEGDPVNASGCAGNSTFYFDQKLRKGDYLSRSGEMLRILQRNSSTEYVVARGWGTMIGSGSAPSHSSSVTWGGTCYNRRHKTPDVADNTEIAGSIAWYPVNDPNGGMNNTYTFLTDFHNHAQYSDGFATWDKWKVGVFDMTDTATFKGLFDTKAWAEMSIPNTHSFAGKTSFLVGNAVEYHPGFQHVLATGPKWFHDINPRLFTSGLTNSTTWTQVGGMTNIFKQGGGGTSYVNPKHFDVEGFASRSPFKFANTLTDTGAGRGYGCISVVNDDCFTGATAGLYFSNDIYDTGFNGSGSQKGCFESEFGGIGVDGCFSGVGIIGLTQSRIPTTNGTTIRNGRLTRILKREGMEFRPAATINAMSDPTGTAIFPRDMPQYIVPPKFNSLRADGFNTFRQIPVTVTSVPAGTSTALVQFGYDGGFVCSRNRGNTCYAESSALNETTPFMWDHETLTGVSCGSGCTITIPAIANRVLYWRMVYRNGGGSVIATGATNVQAVQ